MNKIEIISTICIGLAVCTFFRGGEKSYVTNVIIFILAFVGTALQVYNWWRKKKNEKTKDDLAH